MYKCYVYIYVCMYSHLWLHQSKAYPVWAPDMSELGGEAFKVVASDGPQCKGSVVRISTNASDMELDHNHNIPKYTR